MKGERIQSILLAAASGTFTVDLSLLESARGVREIVVNLEVRGCTVSWVDDGTVVPIVVDVMLPERVRVPLSPAALRRPVTVNKPTLRITGTVTVPVGGGAYATVIIESEECK